MITSNEVAVPLDARPVQWHMRSYTFPSGRERSTDNAWYNTMTIAAEVSTSAWSEAAMLVRLILEDARAPILIRSGMAYFAADEERVMQPRCYRRKCT